ncbi:MAG: hypothetical protein ABFR75_13520 [Acidobacteriota bacterium]
MKKKISDPNPGTVPFLFETLYHIHLLPFSQSHHKSTSHCLSGLHEKWHQYRINLSGNYTDTNYSRVKRRFDFCTPVHKAYNK